MLSTPLVTRSLGHQPACCPQLQGKCSVWEHADISGCHQKAAWQPLLSLSLSFSSTLFSLHSSEFSWFLWNQLLTFHRGKRVAAHLSVPGLFHSLPSMVCRSIICHSVREAFILFMAGLCSTVHVYCINWFFPASSLFSCFPATVNEYVLNTDTEVFPRHWFDYFMNVCSVLWNRCVHF